MNKDKKIIISWLLNFELIDELEFISIGNFQICSHSYAYRKFPNEIHHEATDYNSYFLIYETREVITDDYFSTRFIDIMEDFFKVLLYYLGTRLIVKAEFDVSKNKINDPKINVYHTREELTILGRTCSCECQNDYIVVNKDFYKPIGNNRKIGYYIDKKPTTEIEKKISLAVNWIGNALNNRNLIEGYTQLCIAIETLLSGESSPFERGTAYQIREYGAFLCSIDKEERKIILNEIRDLYAIRCSIAHSGITTKLTEEKYYRLLKILKKIIDKLYELQEIEAINTFAELSNYIDDIKFS